MKRFASTFATTAAATLSHSLRRVATAESAGASPSINADQTPIAEVKAAAPLEGSSAMPKQAPQFRRVGNVFIVTCVDHPFKHTWEVNRMLRDLRLEFMGQTTIVPDLPQVRKALWRVRAVVRVDMLDLDEAKALVGVPEHISFTDLNAQIPATFGRGKAVSNPHMRSKYRFMQLRRMRLRDVMHRDELEKKILEEKRKMLMRNGAEKTVA